MHQFPNFNNRVFEISECISNLILHCIFIYPCWDLSQYTLVKGLMLSMNFDI